MTASLDMSLDEVISKGSDRKKGKGGGRRGESTWEESKPAKAPVSKDDKLAMTLDDLISSEGAGRRKGGSKGGGSKGYSKGDSKGSSKGSSKGNFRGSGTSRYHKDWEDSWGTSASGSGWDDTAFWRSMGWDPSWNGSWGGPSRSFGEHDDRAGPSDDWWGGRGRDDGWGRGGDRFQRDDRDDDRAIKRRREEPKTPKNPPTVKVSNIAKDLSKQDIKEAFEQEAGTIKKCELNSRTGVAIIEFASPAGAKAAVEQYDRGEMNGKTISVTFVDA